MNLRHASIAIGLLVGPVQAQEPLFLVDVGQSFERVPKLVIVMTPGVDRSATLFWEQELEQSGVDVWLLPVRVEIESEEAYRDYIRRIDEVWPAGSYDILTHGYAGRLVVDANPKARRMALVGAPLGPQFTPTVSAIGSTGVVVDGLPWPSDLLGPLPMQAMSATLAQSYLEWEHRESARDPDAEVLLVASGADVVAPVECVRLPSRDWSDRHFWRADAFTVHPLKHGDLLKNKAVLRELKRFLVQ